MKKLIPILLGSTCLVLSACSSAGDATSSVSSPPAAPRRIMCWNGTTVKNISQCPIKPTPTPPPVVVVPPPTPPAPPTKICADGSTVLETATCPVVVPPVPPIPVEVGGYVPSPTPDGDVPVDFPYEPQLNPSAIPASNVPDLGAFRFDCGAGPVRADDPIVYPSQPGKSHLHQFFGNDSVTAYTTGTSLALTGHSTCGDPKSEVPVNRSGYWIPALLNGLGSVIQPDEIGIYYKRWPSKDPHCNTQGGYPAAFNVEGVECRGIPTNIRFIFGFNMLNPTQSPTGAVQFMCVEDLANYETMTQALNRCKVKAAGTKVTHLIARIEAPSCWNGKFLDSPDHRSHVAYAAYGRNPDGSDGWGYLRCPDTHPIVIPTFTATVNYTILPTDDTSKWSYSCDAVMGTAPGVCFHGDYWERWHPKVRAGWLAGCIEQDLNCVAGNMGNGFGMIGADQSRYYDAAGNLTFKVNPNRLIPIPTP
jgi:hypothetical protein